jgi:hypothetical protein
MGSWGSLALFDEARYVREIVPALRAGDEHPLVAKCISDHSLAPAPLRFLAACLRESQPDLYDGARACGSAEFVNWDQHVSAALFEALAMNCISGWYYVGREYSPLGLLHDMKNFDPATEALVKRLNDSGWSHGSGGFGEGVRGWLTVDQSQQLAQGLATMTCEYDLSEFAAGDQYLISAQCQQRRIDGVRHTLEIAVARGLGVMWGVDMRLAYAELGSFYRRPRIRFADEGPVTDDWFDGNK